MKEKEYIEKYSEIPLNYNERLSYMMDKFNLSDKKMLEIIQKRDNMINNLWYYDFNIVQLLEVPEGAKRPRFRLTKKNFPNAAIQDPVYIHVYSPGAKDDSNYMRRLTNDEIIQINGLINTPCEIHYYAYIETPSSFNITDTFLAEIGLIRPHLKKPDWDNIGKKYSDMYNYNIWLDDTLVIDGCVHKYYSILPRVEIQLRYLNSVYNKYQYNHTINRKDYDNTPLQYLDNKGEIKYG